MSTPASPARSVGQPAKVAAAMCVVHAIAALGFAVFFVQDTISGGAGSTVTALASAGMFLLLGVGLLVLAKGWISGRDWQRTPTMLWMVLVLPVAWSLKDAGRTGIAAALFGTALIGFVGALGSPPRDPMVPDDEV